jgi:hypothetical protein
MSYLTQATIAFDPAMANRVAQAAASEAAPGDPDVWTATHRRTWAAAPGWDAAWESAIAGGVPDPGSDPGVITDPMILSQVQVMLGLTP